MYFKNEIFIQFCLQKNHLTSQKKYSFATKSLIFSQRTNVKEKLKRKCSKLTSGSAARDMKRKFYGFSVSLCAFPPFLFFLRVENVFIPRGFANVFSEGNEVRMNLVEEMTVNPFTVCLLIKYSHESCLIIQMHNLEGVSERLIRAKKNKKRKKLEKLSQKTRKFATNKKV